MQELLLFASPDEQAAAAQRLRTAFPNVVMTPEARDSIEGCFYPLRIELGPVMEYDFAEWAVENGLLSHCVGLALSACDPSCGWMSNILQAARLRERARKLEGESGRG